MGDDPFAPIGATTVSESIPGGIKAEWALWGKEEQRTALHVLRCSKGALTEDDFRDVCTRYATGVKEDLPQYTVYWIPADAQRRRPQYLAVGIHELADADPALSGGRSRHVAGRIVEYIRLFCFEYADIARLESTYADLVHAVLNIQLLPSQSEPIQVRLPASADPPATGGPAELAASLLLTQRPVCVLDADRVGAEQRLAFIDEVVSLLPFGLRATLSASTWASPTALDLKLRLFFSSARRDGEMCHVSWTHPDRYSVPPGTYRAMEFYGEWLREAGVPARAHLSRIKDPVRFTDEEISRALAQLTRNQPLQETFAELSASLRTGDQSAVSTALRQLKPYVNRPVDPSDREVYRSLVEHHQLLADRPELHHSTRTSLYQTMLKLAYGDVIDYVEYCGIERAAGGAPGTSLQKVLRGGNLMPLPRILTEAESGQRDAEVMGDLVRVEWTPLYLLFFLDEQVAGIQPRHRLTLDLFAVSYLCLYAADPKEELKQRGYLSGFFARAYPEDLQRQRLESILRLVYGNGDPAQVDVLSQKDIVEIFSRRRLRAIQPLAEVAKDLAKPKLWQLIGQEATYAQLTLDGEGETVAKLRQANRRRVPLPRSPVPASRPQAPRRHRQVRHPSEGAPATFLMVPMATIKGLGIVLFGVAVVTVGVWVYIVISGG